MKRIETGVILIAVFLLVAFFSVEAFASGRGKNPRGKPFIKLQSKLLR